MTNEERQQQRQQLLNEADRLQRHVRQPTTVLNFALADAIALLAKTVVYLVDADDARNQKEGNK